MNFPAHIQPIRPDGCLPRVWRAANAVVRSEEDKLWLLLWSFYKSRHPVWRRKKGWHRGLTPDLSQAGKNKWAVHHYIQQLKALKIQ